VAYSEDIVQPGPTRQISVDEYFPLAPGDQWDYLRTADDGTSFGSVRFTVLPDPAGAASVVMEEDGIRSRYRRDADGITLLNPLPEDWPQVVRDIVGELRLYSSSISSSGSWYRRAIRRGPLGMDVDGDGHEDGFQLEYTESHEASSRIQLPAGEIDTVVYRTRLRIQVEPSRRDFVGVPVVQTETAHVAKGYGVVKRTLSVSPQAPGASVPRYTLTMIGARIDGVHLAEAIRVPLYHGDVVNDGQRARYYASLPREGRLALIDVETGHYERSRWIGGQPNLLAISPDASTLFVSLDETGEILQLSLPALEEVGRLVLPRQHDTGRPCEVAAMMLRSNSTDSVIVMLRSYWNLFGTHECGALWLNGTTPWLTWDTDGAVPWSLTDTNLHPKLYGLDGTVPFVTLREWDYATGQAVVSSSLPIALPELPRYEMDWYDDRLLVHASLFSTQGGLSHLSDLTGVAGCRNLPHLNGQLMCLSGSSMDRGLELSWVDKTTLSTRERFRPLHAPEIYGFKRLVPGGFGRVLISYPHGSGGSYGLMVINLPLAYTGVSARQELNWTPVTRAAAALVRPSVQTRH
jgi:hypothetical protein